MERKQSLLDFISSSPSPSLHFRPCRSGRSQQGWDSCDTSPLPVGRASDMSCKLRVPRCESAKEEDLGNGKWAGAEKSDLERNGKATEKERRADVSS